MQDFKMMGQYYRVMNKDHHRANKDGAVYYHMIVAERKLGRKLLPGETVHHRDEDKLNNDPNNLLVFESMSDHTRFHGLGADESLLKFNKNGSVYVEYPSFEECPMCGGYKNRRAKLCMGCRKQKTKNTRKSGVTFRRVATEKPSKKCLEDLVKDSATLGFEEAGRLRGITGNGVKRRLKSNGYPHLKEDVMKLYGNYVEKQPKPKKLFLASERFPGTIEIDDGTSKTVVIGIDAAVEFVESKKFSDAKTSRIRDGVVRVLDNKRNSYLGIGFRYLG